MARTNDDDFMFLNEDEVDEVEDIPEVGAGNPREVRVNGRGQKVLFPQMRNSNQRLTIQRIQTQNHQTTTNLTTNALLHLL